MRPYPPSTCLTIALDYAMAGLESKMGVPEETYHSAYYLTMALKGGQAADDLSAAVVASDDRYYIR